MKKFLTILVTCVLLSCSSENAPDCLQNAGTTIQEEFEVSTFDKITVFERIELIIKDEPVQNVTVETGEFLLNDIDVSVVDGELILKNNNACNLFRDYGITKVFVSAPNLTEIRNASGLDVSSDGVLTYSNLLLLSEDFGVDEGTFRTSGDFNLEVDCEDIVIRTNNLSNIFMSGEVENINIRFFSGDGRFEGADLVAQNVEVFHRSSNDIIVNPQESLIGQIRSTGDVISLNQPAIVDIEEFYTGRLIFN